MDMCQEGLYHPQMVCVHSCYFVSTTYLTELWTLVKDTIRVSQSFIKTVCPQLILQNYGCVMNGHNTCAKEGTIIW